MIEQEHLFSNNDGWLLHLRQVFSGPRLDVKKRPLLIIPGYGMNAFLFSFHPRGLSIEAHFAKQGWEVWSLNMRGMGKSRPLSARPPRPSLASWADVDISAAVQTVLRETQTSCDRVDLLGCSLGGAMAYAHVALRPEHRIGAVATAGSPLCWHEVPTALRFLSKAPGLIGRIPIRGSRFAARRFLPLLAKYPKSLEVYLNPDNVDLSAADQLVKTIEDAHPGLNQELMEWMRDQDLILRGVNVTEGLKAVSLPLCVALTNRDGIVPDANALAALDAWGGDNTHTLRVGDDERWYAHADLFIGNHAPVDFYEPLSQWYEGQQG